MGAHVRCRQAVGSTRTAVGVADSKLFQMRSVVAVSPDRLRTMRESAFSEAVSHLSKGPEKGRGICALVEYELMLHIVSSSSLGLPGMDRLTSL